MNILLSGFNPFGSLTINSSQAIVEAIQKRWVPGAKAQLTTAILPTEYASAENQMRNLIRQLKPDIVLSLGVSQSLKSLSLERLAVNCDDESQPDNAGDIRQGQQIVADGPPAYWSSLPLDQMWNVLKKNGVPVSFSNHAGTYVCNHVFYVALHEVNLLNLKAKCGFIHVPSMLPHSSGPDKMKNGLPLDVMVAAIESCIVAILN